MFGMVGYVANERDGEHQSAAAESQENSVERRRVVGLLFSQISVRRTVGFV